MLSSQKTWLSLKESSWSLDIELRNKHFSYVSSVVVKTQKGFIHKGIYWCTIKKVCYILYSKPFFYILHWATTQIFACVIWIFLLCFWVHFKKSSRGTLIFVMHSATLSMAIISMRTNPVSRSTRVKGASRACMYVCMHAWTPTCMYVCMYVLVFVWHGRNWRYVACMCICMYDMERIGGMYVCTYVCVYVCVYVCIYICVCACMYDRHRRYGRYGS